jgi:hypothetical protein
MKEKTNSNMENRMTTREKVLLTILLACLCSWLFGCSREPSMESAGSIVIIQANSEVVMGDVDEAYLQKIYGAFNDLYFDNKLPKDTKITLSLGNPGRMAETGCVNDNGTNCTIDFNQHHVTAARTAETTMLHEMCHIKVWSKTLDKNRPPMDDQQAYDHSRAWQGCMLDLDTMGAFRRTNIDYYQGK